MASISETSGEFGVAMGMAAMGSLATFVHRTGLDGDLPAGLPGDAASAAREGLTAAVATAEHLAGRLGAELLDSARTAFTGGLNAVALTGAVVFLTLAVAAALILRDTAARDGAAGD
ncbi:hypothetical protein Skr01_30240 [Sphaerisporangium krabiense]|uniref:MFS transporter n=1 Tax=Sphaerisporangium krabiense TaxID=763782 RepID=A0A7W8Z1Y2_9ACTN|nr:hypothetical protein [Sphaerisporangium krabiense]MBB5625725.1 hypothetical protein [Sphaerisporangium krabiense]GII62939.1 hypothetical protein Skr01_30240 [Sphaerisporangium krabiense]